MSYIALARKWRPRRFEDVLGQSHVIKALSHALAGDRLHPAILLTGTRGVGKTTLARIIAKGLNCETSVTATPCGQCGACTEIDQGRFVDLLEIDAASHTGVDNVRDLIDNAQYSPSRGRYKVYLIDEVHMLSKPAFNALLKTLEEPPPHVKFVLATTDPGKLPITVLSRCLQFNLKRLPAGTIRELLSKVLGDEKLQAEPGAVAEIARAADGSMRDGLSLLDQAIAYCGGKELKRGQVEEMMGTHGRRTLFDVLRAVHARDAKALLGCVEKLDALAPDYSALMNDLAALLQRIAVLQVLPDSADEEDDAALPELSAEIPAEDTQLYYQIVTNGRRDLPWAPDPRLGFEMTLLRLLAFRPGGEASGTGTAQRKIGAQPGASAPIAADAGWAQRVEALELDGFAKQLARHCAWDGQDGAQVRLLLDARVKHLLRDERRTEIEQALSRQLNREVRVTIEVRDGVQETPAMLDQQRLDDRQREALKAIENDSGIQELRRKMGARIRPGSVQPLDNGGK